MVLLSLPLLDSLIVVAAAAGGMMSFPSWKATTFVRLFAAAGLEEGVFRTMNKWGSPSVGVNGLMELWTPVGQIIVKVRPLIDRISALTLTISKNTVNKM